VGGYRDKELGVRSEESFFVPFTEGINQAAIMLAKFKIFPEEVELRQTVACRYNELLSTIHHPLKVIALHSSYLTPQNTSASLNNTPLASFIERIG